MRLSENTKGWLQALAFGVLLFVLWPIVGLNKALPIAAAAVVFSVLLEEHWQLSRERVFQCTITAFVIVHVVAIWLIPFGRPRMGLAAVPFAFLDYFILSAIVGWIQRRWGRTNER